MIITSVFKMKLNRPMNYWSISLHLTCVKNHLSVGFFSALRGNLLFPKLPGKSDFPA